LSPTVGVSASLRSVLYRLKDAYHDGTKAIVFPPLVFVEKLCALIPPPSQNLVTNFGVFALNAALRASVVPTPKPEEVTRHCRRRKMTSGSAETDRQDHGGAGHQGDPGMPRNPVRSAGIESGPLAALIGWVCRPNPALVFGRTLPPGNQLRLFFMW
jgi:hypothetical protein